MMKERPIIMTPENAQKCHEGTKTQTRRIITIPSWASDDDMLKLASQRPETGIAYYVDGRPVKRLTCPYGVVGTFSCVMHDRTETCRPDGYWSFRVS